MLIYKQFVYNSLLKNKDSRTSLYLLSLSHGEVNNFILYFDTRFHSHSLAFPITLH